MGVFVQTRRKSQTDAWQCDVSKSASMKCMIIVKFKIKSMQFVVIYISFYYVISLDFRAVFAPACLSHEVLLKK